MIFLNNIVVHSSISQDDIDILNTFRAIEDRVTSLESITNDPTELLIDGVNALFVAYEYKEDSRDIYKYYFERGHRQIRIAVEKKANVNHLQVLPVLTNPELLRDDTTIDRLIEAGIDVTKQSENITIFEIVAKHLKNNTEATLQRLEDLHRTRLDANQKLSKKVARIVKKAQNAVVLSGENTISDYENNDNKKEEV